MFSDAWVAGSSFVLSSSLSLQQALLGENCHQPVLLCLAVFFCPCCLACRSGSPGQATVSAHISKRLARQPASAHSARPTSPVYAAWLFSPDRTVCLDSPAPSDCWYSSPRSAWPMSTASPDGCFAQDSCRCSSPDNRAAPSTAYHHNRKQNVQDRPASPSLHSRPITILQSVLLWTDSFSLSSLLPSSFSEGS